jgi:transposase-like protein
MRRFGARSLSWRCLDCRRLFEATTRTVFEDLPLPLVTWLSAVRLLRRPSASARQVAQALELSEETAAAITSLVERAQPAGKSFDGLLRALTLLEPATTRDLAEPEVDYDPGPFL